MSLPKTYKRAVFPEMGKPLVVEDAPLNLPGKGEVLVKIEACGVCHTDMYAQYNGLGGGFPLVPGHEIIGNVAAIGDGVTGFSVGDRVGAGYHGGHDGSCDSCKEGWPSLCDNLAVNGLTKNGGFAEYTILRYEAVAHIPKDVDASNYAPMLCAGSTVYNALRHSGLGPGDTVAIQGLGGVGHMAIPFAAKMGYRVVAISRGSDKEAAARKLGAHEYIDSNKGDPGAALKALGGAKVVLTTALAGDAIPPLIKGVKVLGKIAIISLPGDVTVNPLEMIAHGVSIQAWPVGSAEQSEKAIEFAQLHNLTCETETFPLSRAQDAYDAMMNGTVRFRAVIVM